tara:strand:- start:4992 stop:6020 length:1029 start_codon:yes stop_codon:yes gene_type:complete
MQQEALTFNRLVLHPSFKQTVKEINDINIALPLIPSQVNMDLQNYIFPPNGQLITPLEEIKTYDLNAKNGENISVGFRPISAYDESINKFEGLEGSTYLTSHSLILHEKNDFLPVNLLTLYFYTRSKEITGKSEYIKYSQDPDMDSKKDYIKDKIKFLEENVPKKSILFIDGPLIGGDVYTFMIHAINKFLDKDIIPIFFVKNSTSNLVIDNITQLNGKYNSDMHWAFNMLKPGQRTNFFQYADKNNIKNAKIFCYFKSFNLSPQRIEFHIGTFNKYKDIIPSILDLIHYFILVQGNNKNPQLRPIDIAEKFARSTLKLVDLNKLMKNIGLIPTMNQDRFAW